MSNLFANPFVAIILLTALTAPLANAAEPPGPWTLEQAQAHLKLYPHDAYVQYVALQLARREGKVAEVAMGFPGRGWNANAAMRRREDVDLFSIFSGALAVQESLQLDAMTADQPGAMPPGAVPPGAQPGIPQRGRNAGRQGPGPLDTANIAIKTLIGPTIKSHPWEQMLAGKRPEISLLARSVPSDFYFVEFRSINKMLEAAKIADLWGTHLFSQSAQEAHTQLAEQRLREQLAVELDPVAQPFYESVVDRIAITGSDLFVREGSDITLLFEARQHDVFRAEMDKYLANAAAKPGAKKSSGTYEGVKFEAVETPDRRIHVYSAYPKPELHIRTNSRVALQRIIDAIHGHTANGRPVDRLGDSSEFAYIRTLLPPDAPEEDGLIYLSDPFMRRMVGPGLRLTERRRLVCYNNLKMISHAALMYRTEHGKPAASLEELANAECVPGHFGKENLACPDGGKFHLADDGLTGVCSHHGYASYLTPCCEIEVQEATAGEAEAYRTFIEQYNAYWRTYFDPIAVRLTLTPERYRAETIVLPLIDNSIYTGLASALGDKPEQLDKLPVPARNIFSFAVRFDKRAILHQMQMDELIEDPDPASDEQRKIADDIRHTVNSLKELELAILNYHDARRQYPPAATTDGQGRPLLSWRVQLLPYVQEQALYDSFHHNEPWNSEHNKKLISRMPEIFRPRDAGLATAGKTKFVAPRGKATVFPIDNQKVTIRNVTDGTSQTVQIVESADDRAVVWTKPDDLEFDPKQPGRILEQRSGDGYLMAMCDGSVSKIDPKIDNASLAAMFTRAGGEIPNWNNFRKPLPNDQFARGGPFRDMSLEVARQLQLGQLLSKGVGNQVGFHVYDAQQLFDLSLPKALGDMLGPFRGGASRNLTGNMLPFAFLLGSINSPVYISIPVQDREIVDAFFGRLDGYLAGLPHGRGRGIFDVEHDFYQIPNGDTPIRACAVSFGPLKWRFFFQRIGDAVYIASQRDVLTDIAALDSKDGTPAGTNDTPAHALVRLRPQHWNQVLDHYRLGWEENNRQACLKNLGPLSSLTRALISDGKPPTKAKLADYTARLYDVRYFCPDGGHHTIAADGSVTCDQHGSAAAPRQSTAPAKTSELGKLLDDYSDMSLSLTFLEDGLHAIVDLEHKK